MKIATRTLPLLAMLSIAGTADAQTADTCTQPKAFGPNTLYALTAANTIYALDPGPVPARRLAVSGTHGTLIGIDRRPSDGRLYGLTDTGNLYVLTDATTGIAARQVGVLSPVFGGGAESLMDFNPTNNGAGNALRLIGTNDQNFAVLIPTASRITTTVQTPLAYVPRDPSFGADPSITAGAYDSNIDGTPTTTFYMIDHDRDALVTIADRNAGGSSNTAGGQLKTIGGIVDAQGAAIDFPSTAGLDIYTRRDGRNLAVAAGGQALYCIDLGTVDANQRPGTLVDVLALPLTAQASRLAAVTDAVVLDVALAPASGATP